MPKGPRRFSTHRIALALAACLAAIPVAAHGETAPAAPISGAVILAYGRFGEDRYPGSSIRIDQFEAHIRELTAGDYHVLPLPRIVDALSRGVALPDRTVAITIDDAYASVHREAFTRLRQAGLPFTVFVATDPIDRMSGNHMTWDEIRALHDAGVTIGAQIAAPDPMTQRDAAANRADLRRARTRLTEELGVAPNLFAYPQGEFSAAIRADVAAGGYRAAFGLQSGVAHAGADLWALPRFLMNEAYGGIDRFRLAVNALPLPVTDVTPTDPLIGVNPPNFGFTVLRGADRVSRISCFASGQGRTDLEILDERRVEVRLKEAFPPGRARINCIMPEAGDRWRWFGVQFFVAP